MLEVLKRPALRDAAADEALSFFAFSFLPGDLVKVGQDPVQELDYIFYFTLLYFT